MIKVRALSQGINFKVYNVCTTVPQWELWRKEICPADLDCQDMPRVCKACAGIWSSPIKLNFLFPKQRYCP